MVNVPYRAATYLARWNRRRFIERCSRLPAVAPSAKIPATVYSFSGENDWPEQAASIRSFLRFVGEPERFLVVSDGTHTPDARKRLEQLNPSVSVVSLNSVIRSSLPARIEKYAAEHFLGKKLSLLYSIPVDGPTVYADSDILFFPGADTLGRLLRSPLPTSLYLLDCWPSLDDRLFISEEEKELPVNGGFLIFNRPLDWSSALERLDRMPGECVFFTEQTLVHLTMRGNGARPLPASEYILRAEDQFHFSDQYAGQRIALRHYISSIRTKLWRQVHLFS